MFLNYFLYRAPHKKNGAADAPLMVYPQLSFYYSVIQFSITILLYIFYLYRDEI